MELKKGFLRVLRQRISIGEPPHTVETVRRFIWRMVNLSCTTTLTVSLLFFVSSDSHFLPDLNSIAGGYWVSIPYNDTAKPQRDIPALNEEWDYEKHLILGVNIGG